MKEETKQWLAELEKTNPRIRAAAAAAGKESAMNEPIPEAVKAAQAIYSDVADSTSGLPMKNWTAIISSCCEEYARRVNEEAWAGHCPSCGGDNGHHEGCKGLTQFDQLQQQLADIKDAVARADAIAAERLEKLAELQRELEIAGKRSQCEENDRALLQRENEELKKLLKMRSLFSTDPEYWSERAEKAEKGLADMTIRYTSLMSESIKLSLLRADVKPLLEELGIHGSHAVFVRTAFLLAHPEFKE